MLEVKVTIESPELVAAMNNLASAIVSGMAVKIPEVTPVAQPVQNMAPVENITTAPVAAQTPVAQPTTVQPVMNAPTAAQTAQAPVTVPTPVATPVPAAQPKQAVTLDMLSRAGAALVDQGKMNQITELLAKYDVQALTQLQQSNYEAFAADLRMLGAQI